jgi:hypothetical protein
MLIAWRGGGEEGGGKGKEMRLFFSHETIPSQALNNKTQGRDVRDGLGEAAENGFYSGAITGGAFAGTGRLVRRLKVKASSTPFLFVHFY